MQVEFGETSQYKVALVVHKLEWVGAQIRVLVHKCGLVPPNTQPKLMGDSPVEAFLGGAKVILGLLELPHPALPSLLLLNAGLVSPVCVPGQSTRCIYLQTDKTEVGYCCRVDLFK